ncbi:MAG: hypothetical protein JNG90_08425 [Planctomycetaceae bacterium]|nr:hypothetical protein [Planctomycetaceae bacterium]
MCNRRWIFAAGLTSCGALLGLLLAELGNPSRAAGQAADAAAQAADVERELDTRYAKAYLDLVKATQERYADINRRVPNSIRRGVMQSLASAVSDAEERIKVAEGASLQTASEVYVRNAETQLRTSQELLAKANAANARLANSVNPTEVARLQAEVALGTIRLEKARHLASESPLSNVRYEIGQLREMVQELRLNVALLRDRN